MDILLEAFGWPIDIAAYAYGGLCICVPMDMLAYGYACLWICLPMDMAAYRYGGRWLIANQRILTGYPYGSQTKWISCGYPPSSLAYVVGCWS